MSALALIRVLLATSALVLLFAQPSTAESPIRRLTQTTVANVRPAWSPDAKRIAFQRGDTDGNYRVYVMDADGRNARRVSGEADDRHPAWSPDGKLLAVDSGTQAIREIWIVDVASGQRTQVTRIGAIASFPSWSPDGGTITFYLYRGGATDLWKVGRDGADARAITRTLASENRQQCTFACHAAAWSPRGDRIAYSDGDQARVIVMAAAGGSSTTVSPDDERSHFPVYLADGSLVYVSEHITLDASWTDLWALPDGSATRAELVPGVTAQGPFEISADGRQLLFASPRSGNFEIYAVTLDDAGKAALAQRLTLASDTAANDDVATTPVVKSSVGPFGENGPVLLGIAAIALIGIGVELLVRARRMG